MQKTFLVIFSLFFPFLMSSLGALSILLVKRPSKFQASVSAFSAGVMLSAAVWSLLVPGVELAASNQIYPPLPIVLGLIIGAVITGVPCFLSQRLYGKKFNSLFFAISLHNIPEGLAVGFALGAYGGAHALSVALGIGLQNLPEGMATAFPIAGESKKKAVGLGMLSGALEPVCCAIGALLAFKITVLQPWLMAISAGAMIYVCIRELIPVSCDKRFGALFFTLGFCLMSFMDIALSA